MSEAARVQAPRAAAGADAAPAVAIKAIATGAQPSRARAVFRLKKPQAIGVTALLALAAFVFAAGQGAFAIDAARLPAISWQALLHWWQGGGSAVGIEQQVFASIRLPRLIMGLAAGAGLGLAGALMQGLFRNPLADPGLIGVSSGAALAAGVAIVLGAQFWPGLPRGIGSWPLILAAFAGGLTVTTLIYLLAQTGGGTHVALMLLAGVAVNALAGAGIGYLSHVATDEQLRSLQFWLLGSLGGARWSAVLPVLLFSVLTVLLGLALARTLNALALGETQAVLLGVPIEAHKRWCILGAALAVGAVTAATGMVGFIGLVAPHMVRLTFGPDHRLVVPGSALLGAVLVLIADSLARTVAAPAELPLGVLTATLGAPFFLFLLRGMRSRLPT